MPIPLVSMVRREPSRDRELRHQVMHKSTLCGFPTITSRGRKGSLCRWKACRFIVVDHPQ